MSANPSKFPRAFVMLCRDGESTADVRQDLLPSHLDFVAANIDRYLVAGPLRAPEDSGGDAAIIGSLFVVYAESETDLRTFMSGDPYYTSGIYEHTEVFAFTAAAGHAVGGTAWSDSKTHLPSEV